MVQAQTWVEALKISPKKLKEWTTLAPDGVPVLVYVLQEGLVAADQYLAWASQHYHLPVVGADFFSNAFDDDQARTLQFKIEFEWKPWIFPIEQWEGVTYVACVEPPETPVAEGVRLVLADAGSLAKCWSKMASAYSTTTIDSPMVTMDTTEAPAGMTGEHSQFKLNLDGLDETNLFRKDPVAMPAAPPAPEVHAGEPPAEEPVEEIKLKQPALPKRPTAPAVEDAESSPLHRMPDEPHAQAETEEEAPPPPIAPKKVAAEPLKVIKPAPVTAPAAPAAKKGPAPAANADEIFEQLKTVYKNVFLMKCAKDRATLNKWDSSLTPKSKNVEVDLAFPTFLRIISKTNLPYHGYLVDSPAYREFFNSLKIEELPGCVTAIPILDGNELLGVLVCVGDENLQKLDYLKKTETMSQGLIDWLKSSWSNAAAA